MGFRIVVRLYHIQMWYILCLWLWSLLQALSEAVTSTLTHSLNLLLLIHQETVQVLLDHRVNGAIIMLLHVLLGARCKHITQPVMDSLKIVDLKLLLLFDLLIFKNFLPLLDNSLPHLHDFFHVLILEVNDLLECPLVHGDHAPIIILILPWLACYILGQLMIRSLPKTRGIHNLLLNWLIGMLLIALVHLIIVWLCYWLRTRMSPLIDSIESLLDILLLPVSLVSILIRILFLLFYRFRHLLLPIWFLLHSRCNTLLLNRSILCSHVLTAWLELISPDVPLAFLLDHPTFFNQLLFLFVFKLLLLHLHLPLNDLILKKLLPFFLLFEPFPVIHLPHELLLILLLTRFPLDVLLCRCGVAQVSFLTDIGRGLWLLSLVIVLRLLLCLGPFGIISCRGNMLIKELLVIFKLNLVLKVPPIVLLLLFMKGVSILSWLLDLNWSDILIHWLLLWGILLHAEVALLLNGYLGLIVVKYFSIKRWLNFGLSLLVWLQASISSSSIWLRWDWFLQLSSRHLLLQFNGIHPLLLVVRLLTIIFTHLVFEKVSFWGTLLYFHLVLRLSFID